jgi:hypothetical protein
MAEPLGDRSWFRHASSGLCEAVDPALRTMHSILIKVSIDITINFWFTQPIAITAYLPFSGH